MSTQFLIKFSANYADEFDVEGFRVILKKDWEAHLVGAEKLFRDEFTSGTEVGFGTNEAISYSNFKEYKDSFSVSEISDVEAKFLATHFKRYDGIGYGDFCMVEVEEAE